MFMIRPSFFDQDKSLDLQYAFTPDIYVTDYFACFKCKSKQSPVQVYFKRKS
jgi:hypothetical protein